MSFGTECQVDQRTWVIPPPQGDGCSPIDARDYWERRHGVLQYENVYSVTEDPGFRAKVMTLLSGVIDPLRPSRILVPGCGTKGLLEQDLVASFQATSVLATDYPGVARAAAARLQHPRVGFAGKDSRHLGLR